MARALTETLTEAARAAVEVSDWERDQKAWNLPRAQGEAIAREADTDTESAQESDPDEQEEVPPAMSQETSE